MFFPFLLILIFYSAPLLGKTSAILIGVNDYSKRTDFTDLRYAEQDVWELAKVLEKQDHFVKIGKGSSANKTWILETIAKLEKEQSKEDSVFFYFSGHGSGSRLILSDSEISVEELTYAFRNIPNYFLVLDACRTAPTKTDISKFLPTLDSKLISGGHSRIIFYSAAKGENSEEREDLEHSIFSYHFIRELKEQIENTDTKAVDAEKLILSVKEKIKSFQVQNCKNGKCSFTHPETNSNITGNLLLFPKKENLGYKDFLIPGYWQWKKGHTQRVILGYSLVFLPLALHINNSFIQYKTASEDFDNAKKYLYLNSPGSLDSLDLFLYQSSRKSQQEVEYHLEKMQTGLGVSIIALYLWSNLDREWLRYHEKENISWLPKFYYNNRLEKNIEVKEWKLEWNLYF